MRLERARDLCEVVNEHSKRARRSLKWLSKQIEGRFGGPDTQDRKILPEDVVQSLVIELDLWPALTPDNLHGFRIKVKKLRNVLQLAQDVDPALVKRLGKVKDRIGDWHDWHQLARIAKRVFDPHKDRAALKNIELIGTKKLEQALRAAEELRTLLFTGQTQMAATKATKKPMGPAERIHSKRIARTGRVG
jgi:CHAD domain-containing protein